MRTASVDHLVVFASELASGVQWCTQKLGVTPQAGGEHPLMGTHNRLLNISSDAHSRAYLEIIAINSEASSAIPVGARRWFDMDNAALQQLVASDGPQLIAWAASVPDVAQAQAALQRCGLDSGPILSASRTTPTGLLSWSITVRSDGQRVMQGCVPTLIEWGTVHPCDSLQPSGIQLQSLELQHPQPNGLRDACAALGLAAIPVHCGGRAQIQAILATPLGDLTLCSPSNLSR